MRILKYPYINYIIIDIFYYLFYIIEKKFE